MTPLEIILLIASCICFLLYVGERHDKVFYQQRSTQYYNLYKEAQQELRKQRMKYHSEELAKAAPKKRNSQ